MSHVTCQTLGETQQNLNLRPSELGLGAVMFLHIYTIVFAQVRSSAASCHAAPAGTCSQTRHMNLSSLLCLYESLTNSGKSSVVVWRNFPTGGPSGKSEYLWDHSRGNISRQPLRTCHYLYQISHVTYPMSHIF